MKISELLEEFKIENQLDSSLDEQDIYNKNLEDEFISFCKGNDIDIVWDNINQGFILEDDSISYLDYGSTFYTNEYNIDELLNFDDNFYLDSSENLEYYDIVWLEDKEEFAYKRDAEYGVINRRGNEGYFSRDEAVFVDCNDTYYINYEVAHENGYQICDNDNWYHENNGCGCGCNDEDDEDNNENMLFDYHSGNNCNKTSDKTIFFVGFEIEKEDQEKRNETEAQDLFEATGWAKERDGSLDDKSGFELVSPIFDLFDPNLKDEFNKVKSYINAEYSTSCGGHINYSIKDKTTLEVFESIQGYLPLLYSLYEKRLTNTYCKAKKAELLYSDKDKYQSVAIKDNRIEFRIFPAVQDMINLVWRTELLQIMANNPCSKPEKVLKALINPKTALNKHLASIFSPEKLASKIELFIKYSLEIEELNLRYILTGEKKPGVIKSKVFKKGDIVRIKTNSKFYGQSHLTGFISIIYRSVDLPFPCKVIFEDGYSNRYNKEDLELVEKIAILVPNQNPF